MFHEEKSQTSMSYILLKSGMSYIQSKSSLEGTTVYAKKYATVRTGKTAKMRNGDEQAFLVPTKKKAFSRAY